MGDMEKAITGEYPLCSNPVCARMFAELERRIKVIEEDDVKKTLTALAIEIANLKGQLKGYLFAGAFLGAVVGALSAVVAAGAMK